MYQGRNPILRAVRAGGAEALSKFMEELDGEEYGQGAVEDAAATANKTSRALARLVYILLEKGILNAATCDDVLNKYSPMEDRLKKESNAT